MPRTAAPAPDLARESALLRAGHARVVGIDEVGRGALAGPVTAGAVVVTTDSPPPAGLRDSKLLTPAARERLVPLLRGWATATGVGHATAAEVDALGITAALGLAARRALAAAGAPTGGGDGPPADVVLLDGAHDYLTPATAAEPSGAQDPQDRVDAEDPRARGARAAPATPPAPAPPACPRVVTVVRGDAACASMAAASVLAKVERDALMVDLAAEHPGYGWERNRGYGSPAHLAALVEHGASAQHRTSWRLPSRVPADPGADAPAPGEQRGRPPVHDGAR